MEEDGESNIPPEYLNSGEAFPTSYFDFMQEDNDELVPGVSIGEEKVEMFMQELYKEMNTASSGDDVAPSTWTAEQQQSTLMFRGLERRSESCGAAVSDSSSTVMDGVEFAGKLVSPAPESRGRRYGCKCGSYGGELEEGGEIDGCGGCGAQGDREMDGEDEVHGGASSEDSAEESLDQVE